MLMEYPNKKWKPVCVCECECVCVCVCVSHHGSRMIDAAGSRVCLVADI